MSPSESSWLKTGKAHTVGEDSLTAAVITQILLSFRLFQDFLERPQANSLTFICIHRNA